MQKTEYECNYCKTKYPTWHKHANHVNMMHSPHPCAVCRQEFVGYQRFNRHKKNCSPQKQDVENQHQDDLTEFLLNAPNLEPVNTLRTEAQNDIRGATPNSELQFF